MKRYNHIFFDLDHTLWDFEKNSKETLEDLFIEHLTNLNSISFSFDQFYSKYHEINHEYWEQYRMGIISKEHLRIERFREVFEYLGLNDPSMVKLFADDYIIRSPQKKSLMPFALDVLVYLNSKYKLHIITNGFEEIQYQKLESAGIISFFDEVITSDCINIKKPDARIYNHALNTVNAVASECIMVGDELNVDIIGAKLIGMDQVYFNPDALTHTEKVTFEIKCLSEMQTFL